MPVAGNSLRISRAASSPSVVFVGGILMSTTTRSGANSRTSGRIHALSPVCPTTSNPDRSSRLASPSRSSTSSSASRMRVRAVPSSLARGPSDDLIVIGHSIVQPLLEALSAAVQPRHHGAARNTDHSGDLAAAETLDVVQNDDPPVVLGQRRQRPLQALVSDRRQHGRLGGRLDVVPGNLGVVPPTVGNGLRFALALAVAVDE